MGEDNSLNLAAWLRKLIQEKTFQSLTWINESESIFCLPWSNQKKKNWTPCGDDSKLIIEWAKHKYGYREGDEENISKWKTNLRCAINKCPNIERCKDQDTDSYLVCKFRQHSPERTSSTLSFNQDYHSSASVASSAISDMDYHLEDASSASPSNILPTVVQDFEMSSLSNDSIYDDNFSNSEYSPHGVTLNNDDYFQSETNIPHYNPETDTYFNPNNPASATHELDPLHSPARAENNEKHIMIVEVSYNVPQRLVMQISVTADKPNLKIVSCIVHDTKIQSQIYEHGELIYSLPGVESLCDFPEANRSKINDILNNFTRGVSIKYIKDDIFVERNSKVKIFATNEVHWCHEIKRKQRSRDPPNLVKIFDFNIFSNELLQSLKDQAYPYPKDYVTLTIGNACSLDRPSPLSTVLVSIKIRHVQAANDLKLISNGSNVNPDPLISGGDSLDRVMEDLKKVSIH